MINQYTVLLYLLCDRALVASLKKKTGITLNFFPTIGRLSAGERLDPCTSSLSFFTLVLVVL